MSEALTTGQKIFNQRILAEHCMSETQAQALHDELLETYPGDGDDERGRQPPLSLCDSIKIANAQLQYIGLEIVAVSVPSTAGGGGGNKKSAVVRHYAMVNKFPDDVAKHVFQAAIFQPASQQAYVMAVLKKLVDDGTATRADLLNLKNDLQAMQDKVTLSTAEDALERLLEEKWLVETVAVARGGGSGGARRGSNGAEIRLGPRTYCELSYLLQDAFGADPDDLPQQIFLRA